MDKKFYLNVFPPIILGVIIYVFFRDYKPKLINFFFDLINLKVSTINHITGNKYFDYWFIYSLPDGLWAYSLTYFIAYLNIDASLKNKIIWIFITYLLIIFQELFQGSILNGTFDPHDMIIINVGFILALVVIKNQKEMENEFFK